GGLEHVGEDQEHRLAAVRVADVLGDDVERREEVRVGERGLALEELVDDGAGALAHALEAPAVGGGLEARVLERRDYARPALHGFRRGALVHLDQYELVAVADRVAQPRDEPRPLAKNMRSATSGAIDEDDS